MAKSKTIAFPTVKEKYKFPTRFGSHNSMVDVDLTADLAREGLVVCKDEFGWYITEKRRLDNGLADPLRYSSAKARDLDAWTLNQKQPQVEPLPIEVPTGD
jgi:hypothetical protein